MDEDDNSLFCRYLDEPSDASKEKPPQVEHNQTFPFLNHSVGRIIPIQFPFNSNTGNFLDFIAAPAGQSLPQLQQQQQQFMMSKAEIDEMEELQKMKQENLKVENEQLRNSGKKSESGKQNVKNTYIKKIKTLNQLDMKIKEEIYRKETLEKENNENNYDFKKIKSCSNIACWSY